VTTWKITEVERNEHNNDPMYTLTAGGAVVVEHEHMDECWDWMLARIQPGDNYIEKNTGYEPVSLTYEQVIEIQEEYKAFEAEQ